MSVDTLKEIARLVLPDVETIIGYKQGFDKLHAIPHFITKPEQIEELVWSPLCLHNLAAYLPHLKEKKVAVVVKGCDSRTIVQYLQEGLIDRAGLVVIGIPCNGVVNIDEILEATNYAPVEDVIFEDGNVLVKTAHGETRFARSDIQPGKCRTCQYPTPLIYDHIVGAPIESDKPPESVYQEVPEFEKKSMEERLAYWEKEFGRCIRCYACRNACPMCICREKCIVENREPHLMTQKLILSEKLMFHMVHALHLAGRCVECGECERACPLGIKVSKLKKMMNLGLKARYGYAPGVNPDEKPPFIVLTLGKETTEESKG